MQVVISDLHLGYAEADVSAFKDFIELYLKSKKDEITHLIMLGDMLDFWRRFDEGVIFSHFELLQQLSNLDMKIHYVVGNHDYSLTQMQGPLYQNLIFDFSDILTNTKLTEIDKEDSLFGTMHSLKTDGLSLRFAHGYQIDYWYALPFYKAFARALCFTGDKGGKFLSDIWEIIQAIKGAPKTELDSLTNPKNKPWGKIASYLNQPPEERTLLKDWKLIGEEELDQTSISKYITNMSKNPANKESIRSHLETLMEVPSIRRFFTTRPQLYTIIDSSQGLEDFLEEFLKVLWENLLDIISKASTISEWLKEFVLITKRLVAGLTIKLRHDEFLIYGHTHNPYANMKLKMANTGCWYKNKCSFLTIDNSQVKSWYWKNNEAVICKKNLPDKI